MDYFPWARKTESKQREIHARMRCACVDVAMLAIALWCAPVRAARLLLGVQSWARHRSKIREARRRSILATEPRSM